MHTGERERDGQMEQIEGFVPSFLCVVSLGLFAYSRHTEMIGFIG